ncbi:hypothetical protein LR48_Vigan11g140700 [Vigna angularis]|uniref:Uncharacterized protein n=1 Tax=Phaseolus angularis TaxID=3914 RepID=A0A0L9VTV9_PHAAN|nr:hypothetical protein LR48_Vigan11g140700 [Vigna angularis]
MVSIVSDLAKSTLEKLINETIEQSRYICCFTCITDDFEKERENLIAKKETWEEYARVATRRGDNIRKDVTHWQKQAIELIEEDTKKKVTCFFGWCPNCKWQYSRGKELESKTKEIRRLVERNFENVGISRDVPDIEYHSSENYISFKSRKLKFEELFNALKDDNNYMIGLQGMGGTGKTTLAKEVGKELKKSKCYNEVIDTTISNTPDIKEIQDDIAGPLGLLLKDCTESERPKKLKDRLTNGEKILLILDDVWGDINFEEIGIPFKGNHNNCRILVTTRDIRICNKMECEKIIQLDILPEEEGWILFQKHAALSNKSSKSILDIGRKISKECKGLPIAIVVIARSLKGQTRQKEWDLALKSLQKSMHQPGDENWSEVYTCLKYSYDNMKNKTAKNLFLLCSLFRDDEEIPEELLVRFAIGAGLVEQIDVDYNYDAYRNEVIVAKYKLIDSCLLLNEEFESVKMHDLVREMALSIANKEIVAVNTSNKNAMTMVEKGKNIKYLLCEGKSKDLFSLKFDGSKLDILIIYLNEMEDYYLKVPDPFFENVSRIRVLYLSNDTYEESMMSLPQSIQLLTNLRSLLLENFILGDISILGKLQGLETLELVKCWFLELPREIAKLGKLQLLKLNDCMFKRNNSFEVIESCSSLEELYFIHNGISKTSHKVQLPNYQRFCILDFSCFLMSEEFFARNSLNMFMADEVFSKETFKNLVQKAEVLCLNGLEGVWKSLIPDIIFPDDEEGMNNLVEIALKDISQLACLIDNNDSRVQNALSKLVVLKLKSMENLKEICSGPLPFEFLKNLEKIILSDCIHFEGTLFKSNVSLCNLNHLSISECPMLTSLFELSTAQTLVLLENLSITRCRQLKSIVKDESKRKDSREDIIDAHNDNKSIVSVFPNLTTLHVAHCPLLHSILPVVVPRNVPKLKSIYVVYCEGLKYIFCPFQDKHEEEESHQELKDLLFTTLKRLVLEYLPNFLDIFMCPSVNDSNANDVIAQEMSVILTKVAFNNTPQMPVGSNIFVTLQNVTELLIDKCEKVEVLFCASMLECLPYLHAITIFGCNELKQIIGEDTKNHRKPFFPRLKALVIEECNKLKSVFPISISKTLPKLEVLVIVKASMLEEVFEGNSDEKVEIPNLKTAVFAELPSLRQKIEFLTVKHSWVKNGPKFSFSSSLPSIGDILASAKGYFKEDRDISKRLIDILCGLYLGGEIGSRESVGYEVATQVEVTSISSKWSHAKIRDSPILKQIDEDNQRQNDVGSNELEEVENQSKETTEDEDKTHSPENEEEQMAISSSDLNMELPTTKDVNDGDFERTSNSVVSQNTNSVVSQNTNTTGYFKEDRDISKRLIDILCGLYLGGEIGSRESVGYEVATQVEVTSISSKWSHAKIRDSPILKQIDEDNQRQNDVGSNELEEVENQSKETTEDEDKTHSPENEEEQMAISSSDLNMELPTTKDVNDGDFERTSNSVVSQNTNSVVSQNTNSVVSQNTNSVVSQNTNSVVSQNTNSVVSQNTNSVVSQNTNTTGSELTYHHVKKILLEMPDNLDDDSKTEVASGSELTASKEHGEAQIYVPFSVVNIELEDVGVEDIQKASPGY